MTDPHAALLAAVADRRAAVDGLLLDPEFYRGLGLAHLRQAAHAYFPRPAKRLRPAVLLLSCSAVGGEEAGALPAAAAVEVFHTWTLVHDDIIDNDPTRRGGASVHEMARGWAGEQFGADVAAARAYGRDVAILAGDALHGWAVTMLLRCCDRGLAPELCSHLVRRMEGALLNGLLEGECLDVQFTHRGWDEVEPDEVLRMMALKTGLLFEFAAEAGATIGMGRCRDDDPYVDALATFARLCGVAFQVRDDILGVVGDETQLGKPVGSDIREGKRTWLVMDALSHASASRRGALLTILGNPDASGTDLTTARDIIRDSGALVRARALADEMVQRGLAALDCVPESPSLALLRAWAAYVMARDL